MLSGNHAELQNSTSALKLLMSVFFCQMCHIISELKYEWLFSPHDLDGCSQRPLDTDSSHVTTVQLEALVTLACMLCCLENCGYDE